MNKILQTTKKKHATLYSRFCKSLQQGSFTACSTVRQRSVLRRLQRYEQCLRRGGIAVVTVSALLLGTVTPSVAQVTPVGGEFRVNTYTTSEQGTPDMAMDSNGNFVVAWESAGQDGPSAGVYAQRYDNAGIPLGSEFRVNTYTIASQKAPSVAMDSDGDFVVVWESQGQDGSNYGVYGQRYNSAGVPQSSEFRINTYTTYIQRNPSVAMDSDGDFVVAWQSHGQDGSNYGIYARRYNSAGAAQGGEFKVNTYTTNLQSAPSVSIDSGGDFVVAWQAYGQDGFTTGIFAQRYDNAGVAQGGEFQVNTYTINGQIDVATAMDSDGDFVAAWNSPGQDGNSYAVYAQRYNSAGVAQGGEFRVHTYITSAQRNPSIVMDSDGNFAVTWQSSGQDLSGYGVYAQLYNNAGVPQGGEFRVNTYTTSDQRLPAAAMDNAGNLVIAWRSTNQDGSGNGVYAQRYSFIVLPVELTRFDGKAEPEGNVLSWSTATESGNMGFEVEMSADGIHFEKAGFVEGHGNTTELHQYDFLHKGASAGVTYYRLKQLDTDGEYTYSEIIAISRVAGANNAVTIYPNPVGNTLFIENGEGTVTIFNALGQPVGEWIISDTAERYSIDITGLTSGVYTLQLRGSDGAYVSRQLVK